MKRIMILLLAGLMLLAAGCRKNDDASSDAESAGTASETETQPRETTDIGSQGGSDARKTTPAGGNEPEIIITQSPQEGTATQSTTTAGSPQSQSKTTTQNKTIEMPIVTFQ